MSHSRHESVDLLGSRRVERFRLDNGLTLLVLRDASTPLVSHHTWFRVGSRDESPGKTGIAHLLEHMMFGSTETHRAGEADRLLERLGAETNAATWLDWTCFHETFPPEALDTVLGFEADRLANIVFEPDPVEREKQVVASERRYRVEDSVDGAIDEALYANAFRVHPYRHPTIGHMDDILRLDAGDCSRFHGSWYVPSNAVVVVVGAVDPGEVLGRVEKLYGGLPSASPPPRDLPREPEQRGERRVELRRDMPAARLVAGYRIPGIASAVNAVLVVVSSVLCGGESGRLVRRMVREREVASDVATWVGVFADPCLLEVHVDLREGEDPRTALAILDEEIDRLLAVGPEPRELERAVVLNRLGFYMSLGTCDGMANQLGFFETVTGDCTALDRRIGRIERVDHDDFLRVARTCLVPERRTVVEARPVDP